MAQGKKGNDPKISKLLNEAAFSEVDSCMFWQGHIPEKGRIYPTIWWDGKSQSVHRVVCVISHGAPPSNTHHAAHSCGSGHLGCFNGKHLVWKTAKENVNDRKEHGTYFTGEQHHRAKLTNAQVLEIRKLLAEKELTQDQIAQMFNTCQAQVSAIKTGREWGTVF